MTITKLQHVTLKHKTEILKYIPVWSGLLTGPFEQAALERPWQWHWYLRPSTHLSSCPEWQSQTRWGCWGSSPGWAWTWSRERALRAAGCRSSSQICKYYLCTVSTGEWQHSFWHLSSSNNGYLLLMAESRVHGIFVAPSTSTPSLSFPTPCIWTRNSVLIRRAASLSFSLLEPHRESISSMKMMEGLCSLARLKRFFTNLGSKRDVF